MDPATGALLANVAFTGAQTGMSIFGNQGSDTALNDQRWMNDFAWKKALRDEAFQNNYATNYMQIRAADAEKAGLHPLAALGVNPASSSPTVAAFTGVQDMKRNRDYSGVGQMGQDISRAILAQKTAEERATYQANLERTKAETDFIRAQELEVRKRTGMPSNPPAPDPYGRTTGDISGVPNKHILIRNPNGSYSLQWGPEMAFSQIGRPASSLLEDMYDIGEQKLGPKIRALGGYLNYYKNYRRDRRPTSRDRYRYMKEE